MKFDTLIEHYTQEYYLKEARTSNIDKFALIQINADKMLQKLNDGDFDVLITSWEGSPRYGNLDSNQIKSTLREIAESIKENSPTDFTSLRGLISSILDNFYSYKGEKRKTYVERFAKSIINLIVHKEYGLASKGEEMEDSFENDSEYTGMIKSEEDVWGMTTAESSIYNFIKQSEETTTVRDIEAQFPNSEDILDSMLAKGIIDKVGNEIYIRDSESDDIPVLDPDLDEGDSNPLDDSPEIEDTFKRTVDTTNNDDMSSWGDREDYFGRKFWKK